VAWDVRLLVEVEDWILGLDEETYDQVAAAIDLLADVGPVLGRPLVDRIEGSKVHNLKELRPGSGGGSEVTGERGTSATSRSPNGDTGSG